MNVAIIGAGLIGKKRAAALPKGVSLKCICDVNTLAGQTLAQEYSCRFEPRWEKVVADPSVKAVIVATTHDYLAPITKRAILNGKHVLVEKPGARNLSEFNGLIAAWKKKPVTIMLGYNHRYHPGMQKAKEIAAAKTFGEVMFIRARYGHGGRPGYEKEWRFVKEVSGGGELIDQGPHLIDLTNYFVGPLDEVVGFTGTLFWKTVLEDAAFWIMRNKKGQIAQLSVSCEEWKNIFCFEIMLEKAKIQIDGLGGSYGQEKLTLYKMRPEMGPPDIEEFKFPDKDDSWKIETEGFFRRIRSRDFSPTALSEGKYVHEIIAKLYRFNKKRQ